MSQTPSTTSAKFRLFGGLGKTLAASLLVFALVPMTLISLISYNVAHQSLEKEVATGLENAASLKTQEIKAYFSYMLNQLSFQSESVANAKLLQELITAHKTSGLPLADFVKSYKAAMIMDNLATDLKKFRRSFGYTDIFLIAANGDIYYSAAGKSAVVMNLFAGESKSSGFAAASKRTLETGKLSFSDYERYSPSGQAVYGFITGPLLAQTGEPIGIMAFQFPIDRITQIMAGGLTLGETAETYLIGTDLTLRSKMHLDNKRALIREKILTSLTEKIAYQSDERSGQKGEEIGVLVYRGPHGKTVVGLHDHLNIENITFSVIAEIEEKEAFSSIHGLRDSMILLSGLTGLIVILFIIFIVRRMVKPLAQLSSNVKKIESGDYSQLEGINAKNEIGELSRSFSKMVNSLRKNQEANNLKEWYQSGEMQLNDVTRGNRDLIELCRDIITFLARYLSAEIGALYINHNNEQLKLTGSYAFSTRKHLANEFAFGEGLVGQAALEKERILLTQVPDDYIAIQSGLGETRPRTIVVQPIIRDNTVLGIIELGALKPFSKPALSFLDSISENIAVGIQTTQSNIRVQELLEQSQAQSEELQAQQEELREANESLEKQAEALKKSKADLQAQQEELRQTNEELAEQTRILEEQKNSISQKNLELENTRLEIEKKAKDLDIASRYKSEFLANMSHELRTPLNSILLLSQHLADNKEENLSDKQIECASTVYSSGHELLSLINEVLDLSKVEAGQMTIDVEDVFLSNIISAMERNFRAVAENKGLLFEINVAKELPPSIRTDNQRVSQILKNLLSNAFKFTREGSVTLNIDRGSADRTIAFSVKDTGPGISLDKQELVFQAFKQADGSTSRQYGGTGLGLSISRELAGLLGGRLELSSSLNQGSIFSLILPESIDEKSAENQGERKITGFVESVIPNAGKLTARLPEDPVRSQTAELSSGLDYIPDDRKLLNNNSKSILIIEDDPKFAKILRDSARERGFKTIVAESGETGLHLTDQYKPDGIILDMELPGMDGKSVLFRLKDNLAYRHIPVHVISASDKSLEPMHMGAIGYLTKPVTMESLDSSFMRIEGVFSKKLSKVLIVEDDQDLCKMITDLIGDGAVKTVTVTTGQDAKRLLKNDVFDCMILDLNLPDINSIELLSQLRKQDGFNLPVIIYSARDLSAEERSKIDRLAESIIIKDIRSQEKLLDETCLFLHRVEADLPENKREMLKLIHNKESILQNKKILIVDDDMRNVFALINILEEKGINTIVAGDGKESLTKLQENDDTNLVLMDIMMPEMDGYEAMREIRKMNGKIANIPIIALTAKAMKGDRAICIEAGANDYLSKPVDADKLLSMLRVWLY